MASRNFLVPGLDPSLGVCLPLTDLLQMFQQSTPSTDLGWVVISETTPNTVTHPEYATFLWLKASTGDLKYYDGSSWEFVEASAVIADESVTMAKMDASEGFPRQVPQINAGGTAYQLVYPVSLFNNDELPLTKLDYAVAEDYFIKTITGGVPVWSNWAAAFELKLSESLIPFANITDLESAGIANQVPSLVEVGGGFAFNYVESLLRANQIPTNKLQFASGSAGKYPKVNAGGTDYDYVTNVNTISVGTLVDTQVSGTAAQSIPAITLTKIRLAVEVAQTWMSVTSDEFTLAAGTYLIHAAIPVNELSTSDKGYVGLYEGATRLKTVNYQGGDNDQNQITLIWTLTVTVATAYTLQIYAAVGTPTIGLANSIAGIPEVYTQVAITKLA